jgi:hypothetical protein
MTQDEETEGYERGQHPNSAKKRFAPGQRPPPGGGRKKGTLNRRTIIRNALNRVIVGELSGQTKKLRLNEALMLKLSQSALKGDIKSIHTLLALWKEVENEDAAEREATYPLKDADLMVIEEMYARMKTCEEPQDGG